MTLNTLMLAYNFCLTIILIFLFSKVKFYKKRYKRLLINPNELQRVQIFFDSIEPALKKIYKILKPLHCKRGRKSTDYCFQFRWLLWWKFFGSPVLQNALDKFNENLTLKKILRAPDKLYTREIFHGFRKKVGDYKLEQIQGILLKEIGKIHDINWETVVIDSFPIDSYLNTTKCLKAPQRDYHEIKSFIDKLSLSSIINKLNISIKMRPNIETKLIALLVKYIWDFSSWDHCWRELYGKKAIKANIKLPRKYNCAASLRSIQKRLKECKNQLEIEKKLVALATSILQNSKHRKNNFKPKNLKELVLFIHEPHRFKDPGITLSYCAAKNKHFYGRGGVIAAIPDLELPIMVYLSNKYKQSEQSIIEFTKKLKRKYKKEFKNATVVADSEFGTKHSLQEFKKLTTGQILIPKHGTSKTPNGDPKLFKRIRVLIERVIGRQVTQWHLEKPRHLGSDYSNFHIQLCVLCDQFQVYFNLKNGSRKHPHALKTIRG